MLSDDALNELIEQITVDAYGNEGYWSFLQAFEDGVRFPFPATLAGVPVMVTGVDFDGDERRGLVADIERSDQAHRGLPPRHRTRGPTGGCAAPGCLQALARPLLTTDPRIPRSRPSSACPLPPDVFPPGRHVRRLGGSRPGPSAQM
jgi:hypothetical protein